ncbi:MAG: hypothetical protein VB143_01670 [Burkholderia sp.]
MAARPGTVPRWRGGGPGRHARAAGARSGACFSSRFGKMRHWRDTLRDGNDGPLYGPPGLCRLFRMAQNRSISPVFKLHGITARALTRAIVSTKIITTKTITKS